MSRSACRCRMKCVRTTRSASASAGSESGRRPAARLVMKLVIEPGVSSANYWRDLWGYRELMYFLAWRDIVVRYKQTAIGVAWALLRPIVTMVVFVLFRRLVNIESSGVPDAI